MFLRVLAGRQTYSRGSVSRLRRRSATGVVKLTHLANAYVDLKQPKQAIDCDREIGDRRGEGADLGNIGSAYRDLGENSEAMKCYEQALAIHRETGDRRGEVKTLRNLALVCAEFGMVDEAMDFLKEAIAIARRIRIAWRIGNDTSCCKNSPST